VVRFTRSFQLVGCILIGISTVCAVPLRFPVSSVITLSVDPGGSFGIETSQPAFSFGGKVGAPVGSIIPASGTDGAGAYLKVSFQYNLNGVPTAASIRAYQNRPVVVFSTTLLAGANNGPLFPVLGTYPRGLFKFGFAFTYLYQYGSWGQGPDSPWAYFDSSGNTFILSPAAHFPIAATVQNGDGSISAGINTSIPTLPAGFTQSTMLVFGSGINHTWDLWGHAMTDLQGKARPDSDSDVSLASLSYWTDSASAYYYNFVPSLGYEGTLAAVKQNFGSKGLPVGSVQLDSWWYPKGSPPAWNNLGDTVNVGQYLLRPDPTILPDGLNGVRMLLGVPLLVHSRWIDPTSPLRQQYQMSGNVSTDPQYWTDLAAYLASSGVMTYEQDWMAMWAQPNLNLGDPEAYLDNMAQAMAAAGITMQYCGQTVGQLMQGSKYGNLTTARVSPDGFNRSHWDPFLYNSRFTGALGIFPFADNVYSADVKGLVLAAHSAGIVAMADAIGDEVAGNVQQVVRPDGVIVKPDAPMVPLDATYIADAMAAQNSLDPPPMVAFSYSNHRDVRTAYVFAYSRATDGSPAAIGFTPSQLGISGAAYVYNYFAQRGQLVNADSQFNDAVQPSGSYYVVAPVGPSGIALVGDAGKFVSTGRQRIQFEDAGTLNVSVEFAPGERSTTVWGYSPAAPVMTRARGSMSLTYNSASQVFMIAIGPQPGEQTAGFSLSR
jgi:hypothetical protein